MYGTLLHRDDENNTNQVKTTLVSNRGCDSYQLASRIYAQRYAIYNNDIGIDYVADSKRILNGYFDELADASRLQSEYSSCFVRELLLQRDNASVLSNNAVFSLDDL